MAVAGHFHAMKVSMNDEEWGGWCCFCSGGSAGTGAVYVATALTPNRYCRRVRFIHPHYLLKGNGGRQSTIRCPPLDKCHSTIMGEHAIALALSIQTGVISSLLF